MSSWLRLLVLAAVLTACGTQAEPPAEPTCAHPADAADSLLAWQQPAQYDLDRATACLPPMPAPEAKRRAAQLKSVLDARGLYVPVSSMPTAADHTNEDGVAEVRPLGDTFPLVIRRADDGTWRYARETMDQVPRLYAETFSTTTAWVIEQLPPAFSIRLGPFQLWQGALAILLLGLSWVAGRVVRWLLRDRAIQLARRFSLEIDLDIYAKTNGPLMWLASFAVLSWGVPQLQLPIEASRWVVTVVALGLRISGIFVAMAFLEVLTDLANRWADETESKLDDQLIPLVRSSARTIVLVLGSLFVLEAVGVDVWKLLAGVGIGSLVFALAAQDTVANFFGSVNVFVDRPFQIGDWVKIGDVEGVVEEVGFRSTRIRTFYNSQVTMPNSHLTNANVDNVGRRPRRRVKLVLGLTYDTPVDKVQAFVEGVRGILAQHEGVEKSYEVHFHNLGDSALEVLVYYHLVVPDWHAELTARGQHLMEFMRLADALGVSFAFPSTSVYLESTPEHPLPEHPATTLAELEKTYAAFGPGGSSARPHGPAFSTHFAAQEVQTKGS